jgi:Protein of unknown function (DUF2867)
VTVGVFKVLDRQDDEILLGEDDRHLNFRASVQLKREAEKCWAIVSTVVQFNNWLGHAYFVPVRPIHKIIVLAMMRRLSSENRVKCSDSYILPSYWLWTFT